MGQREWKLISRTSGEWYSSDFFYITINNSQSYIAYIQIPLAVFRHEKIAKSKFDFFFKVLSVRNN